jgi:hypothetical protein
VKISSSNLAKSSIDMLYSIIVSKAALANHDLKVLAILKCLVAYGI